MTMTETVTWVQRQAHELKPGDRFILTDRRFDQRPMPVRLPEAQPTLADAQTVMSISTGVNNVHMHIYREDRVAMRAVHVQQIVWVAE